MNNINQDIELDVDEENQDIELDIDEEKPEEKGKENIYPINRDNISTSVNTWAVFAIRVYLETRKIDLQPTFQRSYVWSDTQAEMFIDSIWKGLPIPQLFLLQKEDGKSLVIDGQQRLTSIVRFLFSEEQIKSILPNVEFQVSEHISGIKLKVRSNIFYSEEHISENNIPEKISFEDLDENIKDKFNNQDLNIVQIKPTYSVLTKEQAKELAKNIFHRLNTGGTKLTFQEIRQSLSDGIYMQGIKEIAFSKDWLRLLPIRVKKFKDEISLSAEIIVRAFALLETYCKIEDFDNLGNIYDDKENRFVYFKPFKDFLDKYCDITNELDENSKNIRLGLLNKLIPILLEVFNDTQMLFKHNNSKTHPGGKKKYPNTFNVKYVDVLLVGMLNALRYENYSPDYFRHKITEFKDNENYISEYIVKHGGADPKYIKSRAEFGINFFLG